MVGEASEARGPFKPFLPFNILFDMDPVLVVTTTIILEVRNSHAANSSPFPCLRFSALHGL